MPPRLEPLAATQAGAQRTKMATYEGVMARGGWAGLPLWEIEEELVAHQHIEGISSLLCFCSPGQQWREDHFSGSNDLVKQDAKLARNIAVAAGLGIRVDEIVDLCNGLELATSCVKG